MNEINFNSDYQATIKNNIEELYCQSWDLRYKDSKKGLDICNEAYRLALETGNTGLIMQTRLLKTIYNFLKKSNIEKIENELLSLKKFFDENYDVKNSVITIDYLSRLYDSYGWYEKAIDLAQKALRKLQFLNLPDIQSEIISTLANIYRRVGDYNNALNLYQNALVLREKSNDKFAQASTLNLIARTYSEIKEVEKSNQYYQNALTLRREINDSAICFTYIGLASNCELDYNLAEAEQMYLKCLESNKQFSNDKVCNYLGFSGLGNVFTKSKKYEKAVEMLQIALEYAIETNILPNISKTHLLLSQVCEKMNKLDEALVHLKKYAAISEEISSNQISQLKNVELKLKFEELEHRNSNIIESIEYAKKIQTAMLPSEEIVNQIFPENFILFKPRNIVSGDFYWLGKMDKKIIVCAADCAGHGVPGAFMSMLGITFLNDIINKEIVIEPNVILNKLREKVIVALNQNKDINLQGDSMDLALCVFDPEHHKLQFSGAKNSLILIRNKQLTEYRGDKMTIGINWNESDFSTHDIDLQNDDALYMFSDGYADQMGGEKGKKFLGKNLKDLLLDIHHLDAKTQKQILDSTIEKWKSHLNKMNEPYEQTDDILVFGIKYNSAEYSQKYGNDTYFI